MHGLLLTAVLAASPDLFGIDEGDTLGSSISFILLRKSTAPYGLVEASSDFCGMGTCFSNCSKYLLEVDGPMLRAIKRITTFSRRSVAIQGWQMTEKATVNFRPMGADGTREIVIRTNRFQVLANGREHLLPGSTEEVLAWHGRDLFQAQLSRDGQVVLSRAEAKQVLELAGQLDELDDDAATELFDLLGAPNHDLVDAVQNLASTKLSTPRPMLSQALQALTGSARKRLGAARFLAMWVWGSKVVGTLNQPERDLLASQCEAFDQVELCEVLAGVGDERAAKVATEAIFAALESGNGCDAEAAFGVLRHWLSAVNLTSQGIVPNTTKKTSWAADTVSALQHAAQATLQCHGEPVVPPKYLVAEVQTFQ